MCTVFNWLFLSLSGIKSADQTELALIATPPQRDYTFFVGDFKLLNTLLSLVGPRVCSSSGGVYASDGIHTQLSTIHYSLLHYKHPLSIFISLSLSYLSSTLPLSFSLFFADAFSGPSNLQFSSQTSDSLRFRWTPAGGPVTGYVVQYTPLSGLGQPITAELRQVGTAGWVVGGVVFIPDSGDGQQLIL